MCTAAAPARTCPTVPHLGHGMLLLAPPQPLSRKAVTSTMAASTESKPQSFSQQIFRLKNVVFPSAQSFFAGALVGSRCRASQSTTSRYSLRYIKPREFPPFFFCFFVLFLSTRPDSWVRGQSWRKPKPNEPRLGETSACITIQREHFTSRLLSREPRLRGRESHDLAS